MAGAAAACGSSCRGRMQKNRYLRTGQKRGGCCTRALTPHSPLMHAPQSTHAHTRTHTECHTAAKGEGHKQVGRDGKRKGGGFSRSATRSATWRMAAATRQATPHGLGDPGSARPPAAAAAVCSGIEPAPPPVNVGCARALGNATNENAPSRFLFCLSRTPGRHPHPAPHTSTSNRPN